MQVEKQVGGDDVYNDSTGGFLARDWGRSQSTNALHVISFQLHKELAEKLGLESYR